MLVVLVPAPQFRVACAAVVWACACRLPRPAHRLRPGCDEPTLCAADGAWAGVALG